MKKGIYIFCVLLLTILFLFLTGCQYSPRETLLKKDENIILKQAISYFEKRYPEFQTEAKNSYVAKSTKSNRWFVYLFDKRDKGLGYEVFFDNGKISDNFNKSLFGKRLELIEFMNKLMPENKQYNEYVGFNPYGSNNTKSYTQFGTNDGRVEYVVVANHIDIKKQGYIDFHILKKANEMLMDMLEDTNENWVRYIETDDTDIKHIIDRYKYTFEEDRSNRDRSKFFTCSLGDLSSEHRFAYECGKLTYSQFYKSKAKDEKINCIKECRMSYGEFDENGQESLMLNGIN